MTKGLEKLTEKEYPGRVIIIGAEKTGEKAVVLYAITGRSPSSQARKIEFSGNEFRVKPTDEAILKTGHIDLLIYTAIHVSEGIVVSNGKQTDDIQAAAQGASNAVQVLKSSQAVWEYEPDAPTFTPRISGCILPSKNAALSILKRAEDGGVQRDYFDIPLLPGQGKMISTYSGKNKDPLPSFTGFPEDVYLEEASAEDMAAAAYKAMGPNTASQGDFRVSVVCVYSDLLDFTNTTFSVLNRIERDK